MKLSPKISANVIAGLDQATADMRESLRKGVCLDCKKKFPVVWPPDDGKLYGWSLFIKADGKPGFLLCQECEVEDITGCLEMEH